MTEHANQVASQWPSRSRVRWVLLGVGLMFVSAYSILRYFVTVDAVSNWIGLPQYSAQVPRLEAEGVWWKWLAIILPFLAALLLGFGKASSTTSVGARREASVTYAAESQAERWTAPFVRYLVRLAISVVGTLGFLLVLLLIDFVLYKLRIHAG